MQVRAARLQQGGCAGGGAHPIGRGGLLQAAAQDGARRQLAAAPTTVPVAAAEGTSAGTLLSLLSAEQCFTKPPGDRPEHVMHAPIELTAGGWPAYCTIHMTRWRNWCAKSMAVCRTVPYGGRLLCVADVPAELGDGPSDHRLRDLIDCIHVQIPARA